MRKITHGVIHCAKTPDGSDRWGIEDIDQWHEERGFKRSWFARNMARRELKAVGYHAVIHIDGTIHLGRMPREVGAHAGGFNAHSLGVCLMGSSKFTPEQWDALARLSRSWDDRFGGLVWVGHYQVSSNPKKSKCPGFNVKEWLLGGRKALPDHVWEKRGA